jgi:superfamily I DNA/RNA helicase
MAPVLVVAGAGSGKTTVIARRITELVSSGQVDPSTICALTFSNKGAANLRQRIISTGGEALRDTYVATYHAFAARLVLGHTELLGLPPTTRLLATGQGMQLALDVFDESEWAGNKTGRPSNMARRALALGDRAANHLVSLPAIEADATITLADDASPDRLRHAATTRLQLLSLTEACQDARMKRGLIDHSDEIRLAVTLLETHPEIAATLREQYQLVVLDEYQDTDVAQRELLRLIWPEGSAITAVGDPVQAIYGFRGAHPANLERFLDDFGGGKHLPLLLNHRSQPPIVDLALRVRSSVGSDASASTGSGSSSTGSGSSSTGSGSSSTGSGSSSTGSGSSSTGSALFRPNTESSSEPDGTIVAALCSDDAAEARHIADHLTELRTKYLSPSGSPPSWSEMAVLCRKRRLIGPIVDALTGAGIPVEVVGIGGLLDRPEVVEVMAWLEVLGLTDPSVATLRILMGARYRIALADIAVLARAGRAAERFGLIDGIEFLDSASGLSTEAWTRCKRFVAEREALRDAANTLPLVDLVETIIETIGIWHVLDDRGSENLARFVHIVDNFAPISGRRSLVELLEWFEIVKEAEEELPKAVVGDTDAVKIMTIHQAKGLEFDHVVVPGLAGSSRSTIFPDERLAENPSTQGEALPWWLRLDNEGFTEPPTNSLGMDTARIHARDNKRAEEWRLFYVALTRARSTLLTTAAHWYAGTEKPQGPSEFYRWMVKQDDLVTVLPPASAPLTDPRLVREGTAVSAKDPSELWASTPAPPSPPTPKRRVGKATAAALAGSAGVATQGLLLDLVPESTTPDSPQVRSIPVSALVSFARCPRQYNALYVDGFPRRSSPAAQLGTAVHRWIEQRNAPQQQLWSNDPEPLELLVAGSSERFHDSSVEPTELVVEGSDDIAADSFDELAADAEEFTAATAAASATLSMSEIADGLRRSFLDSRYAEQIASRSEEAVDIDIGPSDAAELRLRGRVDAVYNTPDGGIEIVDFKTGREPDDGDPSAWVQLDAYGLAAVDLWGHAPDTIRVSYVYLRVDEPAKIVSEAWDLARLAEVRVRFGELAVGIHDGRRNPHPGAWCTRCELRALCPEGRMGMGATTNQG